MQRFLSIIGLQAYAVLLALYQGLGSVRTDEAKYLLDIPYPHPPLARFIIDLTESFGFQEMLWRIILATLLVQSVWIVLHMARYFSREYFLTIGGLWIFSAAIIFQSGSIMMAPITAMQGLLFVWILYEVENGKWKVERAVGVALLWLVSLFTAYQAVLYAPIVFMIFLRLKVPFTKRIFAIGIPILLVVLYITTNPLALASFINAGGQNTHIPFLDILQHVLGSWLWAGSGVLSIIGVIGMIRSRNRALIGSFILVFAFLLTSYRFYYAVLFIPLLVGGVISYPSVLKRSATLLALHIIISVWIFAETTLSFAPSAARTVMQSIENIPVSGAVLINGSFGHEWQYESTSPVMRYTPILLSKAKAVVCLESCIGIQKYNFFQIGNIGQEVWVRKSGE